MIKGKISNNDFFKNGLQIITIKTKSFYKKYNGMVSYNCKALLLQETEKAILIRINYMKDDFPPEYSIKPIWIAKSKILELKYTNKFRKK